MGEWGNGEAHGISPTPLLQKLSIILADSEGLAGVYSILIDFLVGEMVGLTVKGQPLTVNSQQ